MIALPIIRGELAVIPPMTAAQASLEQPGWAVKETIDEKVNSKRVREILLIAPLLYIYDSDFSVSLFRFHFDLHLV